MPHRPALAHHSSRVTHHFFIAGPSPSAALRRIDIFFDERPAHSKKYRTHRIGCPLGKERSALGVTSALARTLLTHSARSAIIGSTRLALRAGIQQARSAMPNKSKATHVKVIGSEVLTP